MANPIMRRIEDALDAWKPAVPMIKAGGPFIGPHGGKWADPQHTIPWRPVVNVKPGEYMHIHGKDHVAVIEKVEGGQAHVANAYLHGPRSSPVKMPVESVQAFHDDLNGIVRGPANAPHKAIQDVLDEKAEFLGKGDDGLAFKVGDKVVKVSTGVPYQPMNSGHLTPKAAANRMEHQTNVSEHLRKLGVPGLLPIKSYRHGDKAFQVRNHVDIPKKLTKQQLDDVKTTVLAMHKHGYSLNDDIQVGVSDGKTVLFDTGKAAPMKNPSDNSIYSPKRADLDNLDRLYAENGHAPAKGANPFDRMKSLGSFKTALRGHDVHAVQDALEHYVNGLGHSAAESAEADRVFAMYDAWAKEHGITKRP